MKTFFRKKRILGRILSILLVVLLLGGFATGHLYAKDVVVVSILADKEEAMAEETISLPVTFSSAPRLISFGPIQIDFYSEYVTFSACEINEVLSDLFDISYKVERNSVFISGEYLHPALGEEDENEEIFSSEEVLVFFTLHFKARASVPSGEAFFSIRETGAFVSDTTEWVESGSSGSSSVYMNGNLSSNTALQSLSISGEENLVPAFSPTIFSYSLTVPEYINQAIVLAEAAEETANIKIWGGNVLLVGENEITIEVTAEDKISSSRYVISVERSKNSYLHSTVISDKNESYLLKEYPPDFSAPEGFSREVITFQDQKIIAYVLKGSNDFLILASKNGENAVLYYYRSAVGEITLYHESFLFICGNRTYFFVEPEEAIPKGYKRSALYYRNRSIPMFISSDENTYLLFLEDEHKNREFYFFDDESGLVYPFLEIQANNDYLIPFLMVCGFSVLELMFLILLLVYTKPKKKEKK